MSIALSKSQDGLLGKRENWVAIKTSSDRWRRKNRTLLHLFTISNGSSDSFKPVENALHITLQSAIILLPWVAVVMVGETKHDGKTTNRKQEKFFFNFQTLHQSGILIWPVYLRSVCFLHFLKWNKLRLTWELCGASVWLQDCNRSLLMILKGLSKF